MYLCLIFAIKEFFKISKNSKFFKISVQPLVIGEPQPPVVKSVPADVFRPQFQFFAEDAANLNEEELLVAQQLASAAMPAQPAPTVNLVPVPAVPMFNQADLPIALPAFPAVPSEPVIV